MGSVALEGFGGGGGAALNFKVVGGTSAPASPKENTIWVNTNTAITDWVFSATQPSAKSGRVWISTGTSSPIEFNALKKNGIQMYPISAKQYVSGAWVDKTEKIYQGGKWKDWATYIFNSGEGALKEIYSRIRPEDITVTNDKITVYSSGGTVVVAKEAVDMSKYKSMKVECIVTQNSISGNPAGALCMANTNSPGSSAPNNTTYYPMSVTFPVSTERQIVELKLGTTGKLYPAIAGCFAGTIYNWWLE